jgi:hypothetical protein
MTPHWFFRMARWARNPPSPQKVKFVLIIVGICFAVAAVEHFIGWPDALKVDRGVFRWRP